LGLLFSHGKIFFFLQKMCLVAFLAIFSRTHPVTLDGWDKPPLEWMEVSCFQTVAQTPA
jgi:hypothetical protein